MNAFSTLCRRLLRRAPAQGMTEYGLILTLVTFVAVLSLSVMGGNLGDNLGSLLSDLSVSV